MKVYIGIDPGKSGGVAILRHDEEIEFLDWPKDDNISTYFGSVGRAFTKYEIVLAVLERVHAMPKQGVSSMFTFGMNYGMWRAVLAIYDVPHLLVPPQTWMKGMIASADGANPKIRVFNCAQRLFPHADLVGPKGGKKDGRADALMMAYYASLKAPGIKPFTERLPPPKTTVNKGRRRS